MTDTHAAHDLKIYIDNDGDLYRRQTTPIHKNLMTKRARGEYKHALAVKLFGYLTEAGAKKYAQEFGSDPPWHKMFDVGTRKQAAEELTRSFEAEAALGNYDHLLPKKYQEQSRKKGPKAGGAHARKKLLVPRPVFTPSFRISAAERREIPHEGQYGHARRKSGAQLDQEIAQVLGTSGRVQIIKSGGSSYFKPGQFGYVVGSTTRGGMYTLDHGDSREGELTYLVSKRPKGAGGGGLWFSAGALRFTGRQPS